MCKINVDAALDPNNNRMGFGFIVRDSAGALISARCLPWNCTYKPNEAEAIAVREALKWIKEINLDNMQLESDCLQVINGINHPNALVSSFDLIINDVRKIALSFINLSFLFAKRSANKVAHLLAREALFMSDCMDSTSSSFPSIARALSMDLS